MSTTPPDAGIPLLTEVIPLLNERIETPAEKEMGTVAATSPVLPALSSQPGAAPRLDEEQWARLEREIRERIVQQLRTRVDTIIEQRVQENLSDMLQIAVGSIADELRASLHQVLSDTVSEAVATEISSFRR